MLDERGKVCEYDGYEFPKKGEDTPENRAKREKAMQQFKEKARIARENHERNSREK